jgi:hypothetical protein
MSRDPTTLCPKRLSSYAKPSITSEVAIFQRAPGHPGGVEAIQQWLEKHGLEAEYRERILFPVAKPPAYLSTIAPASYRPFQTRPRLKSFRPGTRGPLEAQRVLPP